MTSRLGTQIPLLISGFFLFLAFPGQGSKTTPTPPETPAAAPIFGDWYALGSGCTGSHKGGGNVTLNLPDTDTLKTSQTWRLRLEMPEYKLDSEKGNPNGSQHFARQCSFRVAFNAPAGMRVKRMSASSRLAMDKGTGVELRIDQDLKYGRNSIATKSLVFEPKTKFKNKEEHIEIAPTSADALKEASCGGRTLLGLDQTFLAMREKATDLAHVKLADNRKLVDITLEMEKCE